MVRVLVKVNFDLNLTSIELDPRLAILYDIFRDFWPRHYISSNETLLLSSVLDDLTLRMNDVDVQRRITVTFHYIY